MKNSIYPCIWFNNNADAAAKLYVSALPKARITDENSIVINIEWEGQNIMLLNGGPQFKPNPSISIMVLFETEKEVEDAWNILIKGGQSLMALDSYPWSTKYGWLNDKFGGSWQLMTVQKGEKLPQQRSSPLLQFTGNQNGKAKEAITFYTNIFPGSTHIEIHEYDGASGEKEGNVMHAEFRINGYTLMASDSSQDPGFTFSEGVSIVVECQDQKEIDQYWNALISQGGSPSQCGWLKDKFGVSWQIIPSNLKDMLQSKDSEANKRVMQALLKMGKLDIATLQSAASP